MSILVKRKFVVEQYENKKTRSDILRMGKHLNLNAMFINEHWTGMRILKASTTVHDLDVQGLKGPQN